MALKCRLSIIACLAGIRKVLNTGYLRGTFLDGAGMIPAGYRGDGSRGLGDHKTLTVRSPEADTGNAKLGVFNDPAWPRVIHPLGLE